MFNSVNFAHPVASSIAFLENDAVLGALQDIMQLRPKDQRFGVPHTIIIDATGAGWRCRRPPLKDGAARWSIRLTMGVSIRNRPRCA